MWSKIARALNSCTELKFNVKQRSVWERFTLLQIKYKETNRKDDASSGTSRQVSELDQLLEDITEKEKDSEESRNVVNAKKDDQDREKAENMRKTAMERVGQTKKRQDEGEETLSTKRRRRSGDETIGYLREKSETERKVREQAATTGNTKPGPDAGDDDGNTTTATAKSKHDSLASATTATIHESHAKFS